MVEGLAAQLTDQKNIQSLRRAHRRGEPEEGRKKPEGDGGKAIQAATTDLLEPIFLARGVKNEPFLTAYRRSLLTFLPPLAEEPPGPAGAGDDRPRRGGQPPLDAHHLFLSEINNRSQSTLGEALGPRRDHQYQEGRQDSPPTSRARPPGRSSTSSRSKELPWPIQLRGLEALGWLRQSGLPTQPDRAHMANTAMLFLADTDAKIEVRAEAARRWV